MDKGQIQFLEHGHLSCSDVETLLDLYLDGEMIPALRPRFEHHLSDCEFCRDLVSDCQSIVSVAKTLDSSPIPQAVQSRLREVLREQCGFNSPLLNRPKLKLVK